MPKHYFPKLAKLTVVVFSRQDFGADRCSMSGPGGFEEVAKEGSGASIR